LCAHRFLKISGNIVHNAVYNVQKLLACLEFTIEARDFKINSLCGPRCQKGWPALAEKVYFGLALTHCAA